MIISSIPSLKFLVLISPRGPCGLGSWITVILSQLSQSIFFLYWDIAALQCQFLLYNEVNQLYVHINPPCWISSATASHSSRSSQSAQLSSLHEAAGSHQLFPLHVALHIRQPQPPSSPFHCPQSPYVPSLSLRLYSCPANRFICIIFLGPIHMCSYMIFVSLFLTYFTLGPQT